MWGWFGSGPAAQKKKQQESTKAILGLRQQLEILRKREAYIEKQIAEQDAIARKNISSNKAAAKTALKRKKLAESNLETTQSHINTLETQMNAVETANLNVETLKVMKSASDAMRKMQGEMDVDKVDSVVEQIRAGMEVGVEINNAITSVPLSGDMIDDDELEAEMNDLEQELVDNKMLSAPAAPVTATPGMANGRVKAAPVEDDEEEELRKLRAEMAINV